MPSKTLFTLFSLSFCELLQLPLITPYLTYDLMSWGKAGKTYLDKMLILQKSALRLIHSVNRQDHAIPLFVNANFKSTAIKCLVSSVRLNLNARHRRKKCTHKYFELVFQDIKLTSLPHKKFQTLVYKIIRSLALAQRYGTRCQIA